MRRSSRSKWLERGFTLVEVLLAAAIGSVLLTGLLVCFVALKRSFEAGEHYGKAQLEQNRLIDYVARDLRRATQVIIDQQNNAPRIVATIPDYYDSTGAPRDPTIVTSASNESEVAYGDPLAPVTVQYFRLGSVIYRSKGGISTPLVTEVQSFVPAFIDDSKQTIGISLSFVPKFRATFDSGSGLQDGTAVYATVLLRNKRR